MLDEARTLELHIGECALLGVPNVEQVVPQLKRRLRAVTTAYSFA